MSGDACRLVEAGGAASIGPKEDRQVGPAVVVHGGAGHPEQDRDGCEQAVRKARERLEGGADALDAAIAAILHMEDDERFNAGTGASLGLDGRTIEMDAGIMDTRGMLAAVAGVELVKNPILVARRLADTPMRLLVGPGATSFAHAAGFERYYYVSETARGQHRETVQALRKHLGGDFPEQWHAYDFAKLWPYQGSWTEILKEYGHGTVGAVVRDAEGQFAVATSTGGSVPMVLGRLGNTAIVGCGYYAGPLGAIAASGVGEYIIQTMLCRTVYEWIVDGMTLQEALDKGVGLIDPSIDIGLIGVTATEAAASHNCPMPRAS
jgi:L-asparaginase/beta-aspartyl-peptidase (threonine type)